MREPFNLKDFLNGKYARVETRNYKAILELTHFRNATNSYVLAGVIDDGLGEIDIWDEHGLYNPLGNESDNDLFGILKDEKG